MGGKKIDLEKVAREQQIKNQEEMEKILAAVKAKHETGQLKEEKTLTTGGRDGKIAAVPGPDKNAGAVEKNFEAIKASALSELIGRDETANTNSKNSQRGGTVQVNVDNSKNKQHINSDQVDFDKVTGKVCR